jgi:hypothetical protein
MIELVVLVALSVGIAQYFKERFGLDGWKAEVLVLACVLVLSGVNLAIETYPLPPDVAVWFKWAVTILEVWLAGMGLYKFIPKQ